MEKTAVRTENAPAPFQGAPYSQAIKANGFVFVSGQLGLAPGHSEMVGDTIEEQTRQVFDNLQAILTEARSGLDRIVKTTVFLASLDDFEGMNSVYAERVGDPPPARSTIEVAALPSGALVEIEAIALA
ncbi:MAG TPA: Rid family detoxifying hydrolase [Gaiellaceae bacterium]|jgi:2-iminobutanoate/2-iminopropanoate deaminase